MMWPDAAPRPPDEDSNSPRRWQARHPSRAALERQQRAGAASRTTAARRRCHQPHGRGAL